MRLWSHEFELRARRNHPANRYKDYDLLNITNIVRNRLVLLHGLGAVKIRDWERREIIEKQPSPKHLGQHCKEALFIIRMTKWPLGLVSDPESPLRDYTAEVRGGLRQLENVFDMIHDPISDAEAEAILKEVFADEQAARGTA